MSLLKNYEVSQLLTSGGTRSTRKRKWAQEFYHHFWRGTKKKVSSGILSSVVGPVAFEKLWGVPTTYLPQGERDPPEKESELRNSIILFGGVHFWRGTKKESELRNSIIPEKESELRNSIIIGHVAFEKLWGVPTTYLRGNKIHPKKKVSSGILSSFLAGDKKESELRNSIISSRTCSFWKIIRCTNNILTSGGTRSTRKRKWAPEFYHPFWRGTFLKWTPESSIIWSTRKRKWASEFYHPRKRKWAPEFYHHRTCRFWKIMRCPNYLPQGEQDPPEKESELRNSIIIFGGGQKRKWAPEFYHR